jgi:hypothetical protein
MNGISRRGDKRLKDVDKFETVGRRPNLVDQSRERRKKALNIQTKSIWGRLSLT